MTNGELVSRIVNDARTLNKDEHISRRYVLSIARSKAKFLISQKQRERSLYREEDLFRTIKCFPLKKDDIVSCDVLEFRRCMSLMKSTKKLPEMIYSKYGNSIISVTTIDGETEFLPITVKKYGLQKKRLYSKFINSNYFYVRDGYLYLPDTEVEAVDVVLIAVSEDDVEEVSGSAVGDVCKSGWDFTFICPDKLLEPVIQDTLQEVISTFRSITVDDNPNLDQNQKTQTFLIQLLLLSLISE